MGTSKRVKNSASLLVVSAKQLGLPADYPNFLAELKERIRAARFKAAVFVNRELVMLYWHIGHNILMRQHKEGWGAKVIDRLANDLRESSLK